MASQGFKVEKLSESLGMLGSSRLQGSRNIMKNSMISQKSSRSNLLSNSRSIQSSRGNHSMFDSRANREAEVDNFL